MKNKNIDIALANVWHEEEAERKQVAKSALLGWIPFHSTHIEPNRTIIMWMKKGRPRFHEFVLRCDFSMLIWSIFFSPLARFIGVLANLIFLCNLDGNYSHHRKYITTLPLTHSGPFSADQIQYILTASFVHQQQKLRKGHFIVMSLR